MFSAAIGALALRDVLQGFLPACLAMSLLFPAAWLAHTELVIGAAIIGTYFVMPRISQGTIWLYQHLPVIHTYHNQLKRELNWHKKNWDWGKLFYGHLDDDERQHLFLAQAYIQLYLTSSAVFLVFTLIKIGNLLISLLPPQAWLAPLAGYTPLAGVNHALAIALGGALWLSAWAAFLQESRRIFASEYVEWSLKYQLQKTDIARRFWGSVKPGQRVICCANGVDKPVEREGNRFAVVIDDKRESTRYRFTLLEEETHIDAVETDPLHPRVVFTQAAV